MKKFLLLLTILTSATVAIAQNSYTMKVGQFNKLKVLDNVNVVYRNLPDSSGYAQYEGKKEFADAFILTPKDGTLKIQVSTEDVGNPELPTLFVYSDFLESVESSSTLSVTIESVAPCAKFEAKEIGNGGIFIENIKANIVKASLSTGNGTVIVSGQCREAELKMLGTGTIQADRLMAETVKCSILGSGSIGCWPINRLNVKGIGSTKIYYKGDPIVKKSGGGKLFRLPDGKRLDTIVESETLEAISEDEVSDDDDEEMTVVEADE